MNQVHRIRGEKPKGAFIPNKLQKNYRLSEELLDTAKTLGLAATPTLVSGRPSRIQPDSDPLSGE